MEITGSEYRQECPVAFGCGSVAKIADQVKALNGRRAFCIFDGGVKVSGIADRVIGYLDESGIQVSTFGEVKPDPTDDAVNHVGELARQAEADIVIGIGGGSVLDTAKMVGVLLKDPSPISNHFLSKGAPAPPVAPVILIPTTSGTGSESTRVAVVSEHRSHAKDGVFASGAFVILDPELTATAPAHITAFSGFDAFAHAAESYTSPGSDPLSSLLALEAMRLVSKYLLRAYENPKDMEARESLAVASNFAGMAFNNTGVHFGHAFGHELGSVFGLPHGLACSYAIPEVIRFAAKHAPERALAIAKAMGIAETDDAIKAGEAAGEAILSLMRQCNVKSMTEQDISRQGAIDCAEGGIEHNGFYFNTLAPISVDEFKEIIGNIYDNYQ